MTDKQKDLLDDNVDAEVESYERELEATSPATDLAPTAPPPATGELVMPPASDLTIKDGRYSWSVGGANLSLTLDEAKKKLALPTKQGVLPSDSEVEWFLRQCAYQGLNPFCKDAYLIGYDNYKEKKHVGATFSTIVSYQAYLKRAAAHPAYAGMNSGVMFYDTERPETATAPILVEGDVAADIPHLILIGGWCRIFRKDRSEPEYQTARLKSFRGGYEARGQWIYTGHWKIDPHFMILKCAVAKAIRACFPFDLGNMYIPEEIAAVDRSNSVGQPQIEDKENTSEVL